MSHLHNHTKDDPRIFVFGSNLLGEHAGGAARYAYEHLGAEWGVGIGLSSLRSYALPTCSEPGEPLALYEVAEHVDDFIAFARLCPDRRFFVSEVGCGVAGFTAHQIAPMFSDAPENCDLPPGWRMA